MLQWLHCYMSRDLKIRRRRRQPERQKSNKFRLAKQQLSHLQNTFCTFLCRHCTFYAGRKQAKTKFSFSFTSCILWCLIEIQLQESLSTSGNVAKLELLRWRLEESDVTFSLPSRAVLGSYSWLDEQLLKSLRGYFAGNEVTVSILPNA